MGVHHEVKDLSRNLGEKHSHCWNFKSLFHSLLPFHCVGATGQVLPGAALQIGTCLCASDLKEVVRKGGQGNLISLPFSPAFCKVSFPWKLGFDAWCVREAWGTSWLRRVICYVEMTEQVLGWGRIQALEEAGRHAPPRPDRPLHLYTICGTLTVITSFIPKHLIPPLNPRRRQPLVGTFDK